MTLNNVLLLISVAHWVYLENVVGISVKIGVAILSESVSGLGDFQCTHSTFDAFSTQKKVERHDAFSTQKKVERHTFLSPKQARQDTVPADSPVNLI